MPPEPTPLLELPWAAADLRPLEAMLPRYVAERRWFRSKSAALSRVRVVDAIPLTRSSAVVILETVTDAGASERYVLPLSVLIGEAAQRIEGTHSALAIGRLPSGALLCDALADANALTALVAAFETPSTHAGQHSVLQFEAYGQKVSAKGLVPHPLSAEQSNSSIVFGRDLILKLFRRLDVGVSTDLEVGRALTHVGFSRAPALRGSIGWAPAGEEPSTLGILQSFMPNEGVAWELTLDRLSHFLATHPGPPAVDAGWPDATERARANWLGKRTAQLHAALAACEGPAFTPEPFSLADQATAVERIKPTLNPLLLALRQRLPYHPKVIALLGRSDEAQARLSAFSEHAVGGQRCRIHGDLHLGQILEQGDDVAFIDFEGEPARSLAERRAKRSPLADVAGMLRSYHYAATTAARLATGNALAQAWMAVWHREVTQAYLDGYRAELGTSDLLPTGLSEALEFFVLEKCLYELGYELNNRPDWVEVPLEGLLSLLDGPGRRS